MQQHTKIFAYSAFFFLLGAFCVVALQAMEPKPIQANSAQLVISPPADEFYLGQITSANKSIDIMLYEFSYLPLKQALGKAVKKGTVVRVILEPRVDSNLKTAGELSALGVSVKWASKEFANTHAKTAAIDGFKLIIGSTNWSQHAMKQNREVSVLIESKALTQQFLSIFEQDWKKAGEYKK